MLRINASFGLNDSATTQTTGATQAAARPSTASSTTVSPSPRRWPGSRIQRPSGRRPSHICAREASIMSANSTCDAADAKPSCQSRKPAS